MSKIDSHHYRSRQVSHANALSAPVFSNPDPAGLALLERLPEIFREIFPMSGADKRHLPHNVALLSEILTTRRSSLTGRPYWSSPALAGAYLWYFLPWNLIRLMGLLPGVQLKLTPGAKILDIGSGPLALPLALWLSRPDLRDLPLRFTCLDSAALPLRLGRACFNALAGPDSPWRFKTVPEALFLALPRQSRDFDLLTACNMLNEVKAGRQSSLGLHLDRQINDLTGHLKPGGQLLIVEPGNRLGGKIVSLTRRAALQRGFELLAPCTHRAACPLAADQPKTETREQAAGQRHVGTSWCHFACPEKALAVPGWLDKLSRDARLTKDKVTLSWLFAQKRNAHADSGQRKAENKINGPIAPTPDAVPGRVVSNPLHLPDRLGQSFYVCCAYGLALLHAAQPLRSGDCVELLFTGNEEKDSKSGAWILE